MEQYISKSALVAEIDKLKDEALEYEDKSRWFLAAALKKRIDTLEVKGVDLEKELIEWHKEHFKKDGTFIGMSGFYLTNNSQMDIAKHFFELGLSVSNESQKKK